MTPNIGILYTIGNEFSPQLTIWDSYLKIRPCLVQLHYQSFESLSRNTCFKIWPLSSWTDGTITIVGLKGTCSSQGPPSILARDWRSSHPIVAATTHPPLCKQCHSTVNGAGPSLFGVLWSPNSNACGGLNTGTHGSTMVVFHQRERERERASEIERESEEEREATKERKMRENAIGWRGNIPGDWLCTVAGINGVVTAEKKEGGEGGEYSSLL